MQSQSFRHCCIIQHEIIVIDHFTALFVPASASYMAKGPLPQSSKIFILRLPNVTTRRRLFE